MLFYPRDKENSTKERFTDEQIIRILHEAESRDEVVKDLCKRHNIPEQTLSRWLQNPAAGQIRIPFFGGQSIS